MISTDIYRKVVKDVIDDTCVVFGNPRYFHLGLDEENAEMQRKYPLVIIRRDELWWRDVFHYLNCLEAHGTQGMMFCTYASRPDGYLKRMPKSVIQNIGLYGHAHDRDKIQADIERRLKCSPQRPTAHLVRKVKALDAIDALNANRFKILGLTSNWVWKGEMKKPWPTGKNYPQDPEAAAWLCDYMKKHVSAENLIGIMTAPWGEIKPDLQYYWESAIDQLADAMDGSEAKGDGE